ncbi:hypothetical protein GCM10010885_20080 [Alicyclobacillus cellulosilyticus]|uniref:Type III restriction enzyme n=1 Tax=Alicyclobacillus cellulosilyticus TaxID=1003997 RepID=A0A917KG23_9BACL|nr:DEAD/DEAH box helicase family protein [Alicyclobacillus cellulosilyticus]GGJ10809.1 hypothetical protein GCM10010885_20080 [Alicyclobacillus cellulosilyticus]
MKIQFDRNQSYQLEAVAAVVDLFEGQPHAGASFYVTLGSGLGGQLTERGFANHLALDWPAIAANLQRIQARHGIRQDTVHPGMDFSIEMETGTGKTYVYLRTIHALYTTYGFTKFVIVVPSVAIREGVLKSVAMTREHFAELYGSYPWDCWTYDAKRTSVLHQFATSDKLQVLVINIDAFNKQANNVIHRELDQLFGRKPIEFIQQTRPIVILDEPQNMESAQARQAIASLHPLCTLRYSATHRRVYNLLYRLGPAEAYARQLVKRIEVNAVLDQPDLRRGFIRVESITAGRSKVAARLTIDVTTDRGPVRKTVQVSRNGTDLVALSGGRTAYQGYVVDHIDAARGQVVFTNGVVLRVGETWGPHQDEVMRAQVYETVQEHLEKELEVLHAFPPGRRLKVLSLFFLDRVAHYAEPDGKVRRWFEAAYRELSRQPRYRELGLPPVDKVHGGYFATDRKGRAKDTSGHSQEDEKVYELIMKDKERLLSLDEPLRFIFSHSALREGWDNPNVFQICTLSDAKSEIRKRQEIGRGLRLPVDETGVRVIGHPVNRLTVIANESYEDFARALQTEMELETGERFPAPDNARERMVVRIRPGLNEHPDFMALWDRIRWKTRYTVAFDPAELAAEAAAALREMPPVAVPSVRVVKGGLDITARGVTTRLLGVRERPLPPAPAGAGAAPAAMAAGDMAFAARAASAVAGVSPAVAPHPVPDLIGYIQQHTELTRRTIAEILVQSGRLADALVNPEAFLDGAVRAIREVLERHMVKGIHYAPTGEAYPPFFCTAGTGDGGFAAEVIMHKSRVVAVEKSVYPYLEVDSNIEAAFAAGLQAREDVLFFVKLPRWFRIDTPAGPHTPDWAVVKQSQPGGEKVYAVYETKGTVDPAGLRGEERLKVRCAKAHFAALGVKYRLVTRPDEV